MVTTVTSCTLLGLDGYLVGVEVDILNGLPSFNIVGLPDTTVKESKDRIRSSIINSNYKFMDRRIVVNLYPGSTKKQGTHLDLPIALALLIATNQIVAKNIREYGIVGELTLSGNVNAVLGALPLCISFREKGIKKVIVPKGNYKEVSLLDDLEIFPVDTLTECIDIFTKGIKPQIIEKKEKIDKKVEKLDYNEVAGQAFAKRAIEIAAAGRHNLIMIGPPGSGKTMLARRIPTVLPDMDIEEMLEVTKIHSISGELKGNNIVEDRPFYSPHYTMSNISLIGGGTTPKPGVVSLAHNGVLFLDEFTEFTRNAIESLRLPIEDKQTTVTRVNHTSVFPCDFILIASMNPCPCGFLNDPTKECTCTQAMIRRYLSKLSGPIMDRIDLHVEIMPVDYKELNEKISNNISSKQIKDNVLKAVKIQKTRYKEENINYNSELTPRLIKKYCKLDDKANKLLEKNFNDRSFSARANTKIIKVARTIADIEQSLDIKVEHLASALNFRKLDTGGY